MTDNALDASYSPIFYVPAACNFMVLLCRSSAFNSCQCGIESVEGSATSAEVVGLYIPVQHIS